MPITFDFNDKVVLITGSSSGIGATTAVLFAKAGASVVVTGRNAESVTEVANQCREVSAESSVLEVVGDVTKQEDLKLLIDTTIETFGRLDVLVNNAGAGFGAAITDPDFFDKYQECFDINLNAPVFLTHLAVEHLEKTKGNIINISSLASLQSGNLCPPYCMAKAALDMFSRCMAAELGPKGIRVNYVNPGIVETQFQTRMGFNPDFQGYSEKLPVGRLGKSEDIANVVLFLASDESSYTTGANLVTDGGHLAAGLSFS